MPTYCFTDSAHRITRIGFDGAPPSLGDVQELIRRLASDPHFDASAGLLTDCRHPTAMAFSPAQRGELLDCIRREARLAHLRWAIVVGRPALYGAFRVFAATLELETSVRAAVFLSTESAYEWLASGRPSPVQPSARVA